MAAWLWACSTPMAQAQDPCVEPTDDDYRTLMDRASRAIEREDWNTALDVFLEASDAHRPAVLEFAIARTLHHLERFDDAIEQYNLFLRHMEGCDDPEDLTTTAREYRDLAISEQAAALESNQDAHIGDSLAREGASSPLLGWVLTGTGSALVLAGAVFDLANLNLDDQLERAYREDDVDEALDLEDQRDSAVVVDAVLYGTGLALAITGVVVILIQDDTPPSITPTLGLLPTSGGLSGTLEVRF